jgi:hypothetical protein
MERRRDVVTRRGEKEGDSGKGRHSENIKKGEIF